MYNVSISSVISTQFLVVHLVEAAKATMIEMKEVRDLLAKANTGADAIINEPTIRGLDNLFKTLVKLRLSRSPHITDTRGIAYIEQTLTTEGALWQLMAYTSDFYDRLACIDAGYTVDKTCALLAEILAAKYCTVTDKTKLDPASLSMITQSVDEVKDILLSNNWLVFIYASILASDFWSKFHE